MGPDYRSERAGGADVFEPFKRNDNAWLNLFLQCVGFGRGGGLNGLLRDKWTSVLFD